MKKLLLAALLIAASYSGIMAQETLVSSTDSTDVEVKTYPVGEPYSVVTNTLWSNWFVMADAGINAFFGTYSGWGGSRTFGNLGNRLTPQFNVGIGKWITPGFGLNVSFMGFRSRGFSIDKGNPFVIGEEKHASDGTSYWRTLNKWWDLNANAMINLTRLICGYEGDHSDRLMTQFILSGGIGFVHHYGMGNNELNNHWGGHIEMRYSRFLSKHKNMAIDVKLRGLLNEDSFDNVLEGRVDANFSLNVGLSYYFKNRGWYKTHNVTNIYTGNTEIRRLNAEVNRLNIEIEQLRNDPVVKTETNVVTFPYMVNFVIDRTEVVNRELVNLKSVAEMIKATPNTKYLVCGYADKYTGSAKRNVWLSEHRAQNVYKILTEVFGVPAEQLVVEYKGGVENMYYEDKQLSRSVIISKID